MTIRQLCQNLGLNQKIQEEAEAKLRSLGINLSDPNDVQRGINSLFGKVKPLLSIAMPLLKKASPKIREATGYSVEELYNGLNTTQNSNVVTPSKSNKNLYTKYDNL